MTHSPRLIILIFKLVLWNHYFKQRFWSNLRFRNTSYRCSCNYGYSSQDKLGIQEVLWLWLPFTTSPKASSHQDHQDSLHPSIFVPDHLLWEQNMVFSRFACDFQGHLGSQAVWVLLEISCFWDMNIHCMRGGNFSHVAKKYPVLWCNFAHSLFSMSWFLAKALSSSGKAASSLEISGLTQK